MQIHSSLLGLYIYIWERNKYDYFDKGKKIRINHRTVVHTAIFEATKSWGRLRVYWDNVDSPNIKYPITATPAYNKVQIPKLHFKEN